MFSDSELESQTGGLSSVFGSSMADAVELDELDDPAFHGSEPWHSQQSASAMEMETPAMPSQSPPTSPSLSTPQPQPTQPPPPAVESPAKPDPEPQEPQHA